MDRAHRIGQTREVNVYRFMIEGSVEEKIIDRAQKKLYLDAAVIQQGRLADASKALSKEEMAAMIRFGADAVFKSGSAQPSDEDLDALLARGEARTKADNARFERTTNSLANFTLAGEEKSLYDFEDQDYKASRDSARSVPTFVSLPKRIHKQNYDENEYYRNRLSKAAEAKPQKQPRQQPLPDFQVKAHTRLNNLLPFSRLWCCW
eukprot:3443785-Pleurochrysis_carterae.AAC.1